MSRFDAWGQQAADFKVRKVIGGIVIFMMLLVGACGSSGIIESVDADEILVVQDFWDGDLHFHTTPGVKMQWWGRTTVYKKRSFYEFKAPVQFNDGGKGEIIGSVQYDLPLDNENLRELHSRYNTMEAVQQLVGGVANKVIYMTGPVMSSRESYAERRNDLIRFAQDQIDLGVYQTRRVEREIVDGTTNQKRVVLVAEIVTGPDGKSQRQEKPVMEEFGIRAFNFSISQIDYEDGVDKQIAEQLRISSEVQVSISNAMKAQQAAITAEADGRANAAKAKWEEEVVTARAVTVAQREFEVQEKKVKTAEAYKQELLLRSGAEATAKRQSLEADGALEYKLRTYERVNQMWAEAFKGYGGQLVPSVVMGQGSGPQVAGNQMMTFMEMMTAKAAQDLALSAKPSGGKQ